MLISAVLELEHRLMHQILYDTLIIVGLTRRWMAMFSVSAEAFCTLVVRLQKNVSL